MGKHWVSTFGVVLAILTVTVGIFLYSAGYRLKKPEQGVTVDFKKTGMISARSIPEGAYVYINGVLKSATNNSIGSLDPGLYKLKIIKAGFMPWEKEVEVFPELVTDITAVLVSQTPRLEPLTNTGARNPVISPSFNKLAYFSEGSEKPGIWVIPLTGAGGFNIFRTDPYIAIEDNPLSLFSDGKSIVWSPDEEQMLVQNGKDQYFVITLATKQTERVLDPKPILQKWDDELLKKRQYVVDTIDLPDELKKLATAPEASWAPDGKKFMYKRKNEATIEYRVFNMEKPLPVNEKEDNLVFSLPALAPQPKIAWYSDSFHLILTEGEIDKDKRGIISLIRIDGTNRTELYNNTMFEDEVFSAPGGEKIIFSTSYRSDGLTNLYTLSIR